MRMVICVSCTFCSMDQEKRETAHSLVILSRGNCYLQIAPSTEWFFFYHPAVCRHVITETQFLPCNYLRVHLPVFYAVLTIKCQNFHQG